MPTALDVLLVVALLAVACALGFVDFPFPLPLPCFAATCMMLPGLRGVVLLDG